MLLRVRDDFDTNLAIIALQAAIIVLHMVEFRMP